MIGELIAKGDVLVHPLADRFRARPSRRGIAKELPGDVGKLVDFAVATGQEERQRVVRQICNRLLSRAGILFVGLAAVFDEGLERETNFAAGRQNPRATIAVEIGEIGEGDVGFGDDFFGRAKIGLARRMDVEHQDHRRRRRNLELDVETDFDDHAIGPIGLYDLFVDRAKFRCDGQLIAHRNPHITKPNFAERKGHERELTAVERVQMRFEHATRDARHRAVAGAIEAGNSGIQFFIELELASDPERGAQEKFFGA